MRENWWLTKGRETIWIKTKLPLKGNLIPIVQMQEKGMVWHWKINMICHFAAYELHQAERGPVLRTAPGAVWHFSPLTAWWTGSSLPGVPLNLSQGQEYWGKRADFGANPGWIQASTIHFPHWGVGAVMVPVGPFTVVKNNSVSDILCQKHCQLLKYLFKLRYLEPECK